MAGIYEKSGTGGQTMRLIDADKLKDTWLHSADHTGRFVDFIDNAPTIDAEPIIHAHWEETGRFEKDGVNYICYRCSICGGLHRERRKQTGNPKSIGCPHCRAKMDEEQG